MSNDGDTFTTICILAMVYGCVELVIWLVRGMLG